LSKGLPIRGNFSAWIGIGPKKQSSGGKNWLGGISKQGDRYLRGLFVAGALAVIRHAAACIRDLGLRFGGPAAAGLLCIAERAANRLRLLRPALTALLSKRLPVREFLLGALCCRRTCSSAEGHSRPAPGRQTYTKSH
jgi:hypothetical protein